jgi:hypothetical protein
MIPPDAQRSMSKRAGSTVVEVKRQPCHLRVAARGCRSSYRTSRQKCEDLRRFLVAPEGLLLDATGVYHGVRSARASWETPLGSYRLHDSCCKQSIPLTAGSGLGLGLRAGSKIPGLNRGGSSL